MTIKCKKCCIELDEDTLQMHGMDIDCFMMERGELVDASPICDPSDFKTRDT